MSVDLLSLILFSLFFPPLVFGKSTSKWRGEKAETTLRISLCWFIACQDFDLKNLFLLLLALSISAAHLRLQSDRFNPNLLSVCSGAALFLLNMNLLPAHCGVCCCVFRSRNRTQIARGNLKWEALKRRWKKKKSCTWQRTVPLIP